MDLSDKIEALARSLKTQGYGFIEGFLDEDEVDLLRRETTRLVKEESVKEHTRHVFANSINQKNDYFINSGDKVRFFFEKNAFNQDGQLVVPEEQSLAKIGHALHNQNPSFKQVTYSNKMKDIYRAIGFLEPTVMQSMVIFKNPKVGGEYTPHQDASFLYCEPLNLVGIWLALDDATEENGCLQFIPGSHNWPLARRFVRVKNEKGDIELDWTAPVVEYEADKFVKVPVKKGSLVLIHGLVVHRSFPNQSDNARWIYTFHLYDKARSTYSKDNWLQIENECESEGGLNRRKEVERLADDLSNQYLEYVLIDTSIQRKKVEETIEECLTHLEEVCIILEEHRRHGADMSQHIQNLFAQNNSLNRVCNSVDAIEAYLLESSQYLTKLESFMDELEVNNGPIRGKLRQLMEMLPRISFNRLGGFLDRSETSISPRGRPDESNRNVESHQCSTSQSVELVNKVKEVKHGIEESAKTFRDRIGGGGDVQRQKAE